MNRDDAPRESVSGLDDLFYDVTLTDASTGQPITVGPVSMRLVKRYTVTPLHPTAAVCALTHQGAGRWTNTHDSPDVTLAIASVPQGGEFDRVVVVTGSTDGRLLAVCTKVPAVFG